MPYTKKPQGRSRHRGLVNVINFELDSKIHQRLQAFCQANGHAKRWVLEKAIVAYLDDRQTSDEET